MLTCNERLLKRTISRCPVCLADAPAEVWRRQDSDGSDSVWLSRRCPEHGRKEARIATDSRFYWLAQGNPRNACGGGNACSAASDDTRGVLGRNFDGAAEFQKLSTCLALIEVVNSCNLACPTCYADSPRSRTIDAVPLEDLKRRIDGVIAKKGPIEILQLSGGEPTLHPQFFELLEWCHQHPGIDYVLLNTNGVRIATDEEFAQQLGRTFRYGRFQLYLQFDGPQQEGQMELRGADLRKTRDKAVEVCRDLRIPLTLAMTITPDTLPHAWEAVEYGLQWPNVRGISFQPEFTSGRNVRNANGAGAAQPLNVGDVILSLVEHGAGKLRFEDFTPLPCGDPNCATIGYLLKTEEGVRSISDFVDFAQVQGFLRDKIRYSLDDLAKCGCESEPLGRLLKEFELDETKTFRLFLKPFMDAWTWDQDRIDRCCTHVIRPDGQLDSFCRYYSGR